MQPESNPMPAEFDGRPIAYRNPAAAEWLYRFYSDEELLYVGITHIGTERFKGHAKDKAWWPHVAWVEVEHYPTRAAVRVAECEAIREELPAFNIGDRGPYAVQAAKYEGERHALLEALREERHRADELEADNDQLRHTLQALEWRHDTPDHDPEPPASGALRPERHLRLVAVGGVL